MADLDRRLKEIEKRKAQEQEQDEEIEKLTIDEEDYDVRRLNKQSKKELTCLMVDYSAQKQSSSTLLEKGKIFIYRALPEMSKLAVKAKEAGIIKKNHDIIEENFTTVEILEILTFICEMNNIAGADAKKEFIEEIEDTKKQ